MKSEVKALSDPVLSKFELHGRPSFYSLTSRPSVRPVGIPNQIRCAVEIVEAALRVELIGKEQPLLVIGGGVAGVTAAMKAASHNVPVRLREGRHQLFALQANCSTRWLHPNQFDWPHPWFTDPTFPEVGSKPMPLGWKADYSSAVAENWLKQYKAFERQAPNFKVWFGAPLSPELSEREELIAACDVDPSTGEYFPFSAYLLCRGLPREAVTIESYSGRQFWDNDPFEEPDHGLPKRFYPSVLISGAGDGGFQDLLRFAFANKRPLDLVDLIAEEVQKSGDIASWEAFCNEIRLVASDGKSAPRISGPRDPCLMFVRSLSPDCSRRIFTRLAAETTFDFSRGTLQLVCMESMPTPSFALNRLLIRFLEALVRDHLGVRTPLLRFGQRITDIVGVGGHVCANDSVKCHGKLHTCKIGTDVAQFNILVVRHGLLKETRILEDLTPAPSGVA